MVFSHIVDRSVQSRAGNDHLIDGTITEVLPDATFRVRLENGHQILAYLDGKMRRNYIPGARGHRVKCALTPCDLSKGRITYRYK